MDVYALAEHGLSEEDCRFIVAGEDADEMAQLQELIHLWLAEIDVREGELITAMRENSAAVTP